MRTLSRLFSTGASRDFGTILEKEGSLAASQNLEPKNECTRTDSRAPARHPNEVLAGYRPVPDHEHPSSDLACPEELLVFVSEAPENYRPPRLHRSSHYSQPAARATIGQAASNRSAYSGSGATASGRNHEIVPPQADPDSYDSHSALSSLTTLSNSLTSMLGAVVCLNAST